jgi:hypothetical protein
MPTFFFQALLFFFYKPHSFFEIPAPSRIWGTPTFIWPQKACTIFKIREEK